MELRKPNIKEKAAFCFLKICMEIFENVMKVIISTQKNPRRLGNPWILISDPPEREIPSGRGGGQFQNLWPENQGIEDIVYGGCSLGIKVQLEFEGLHLLPKKPKTLRGKVVRWPAVMQVEMWKQPGRSIKICQKADSPRSLKIGWQPQFSSHIENIDF